MRYIALLLLLVFISSTAFAAQWVTLAKRVDGTVFSIEKGTLTEKGNSLQFWLKAVPPNPLQLADGREYVRTESHEVILCPQDRASTVKIKYFDKGNNLIETEQILNSNRTLIYRDIYPSGIEDYIAAKFCN